MTILPESKVALILPQKNRLVDQKVLQLYLIPWGLSNKMQVRNMVGSFQIRLLLHLSNTYEKLRKQRFVGYEPELFTGMKAEVGREKWLRYKWLPITPLGL